MYKCTMLCCICIYRTELGCISIFRALLVPTLQYQAVGSGEEESEQTGSQGGRQTQTNIHRRKKPARNRVQ